MTENNTNKKIKIRIENPCMGVPITYLDKYNPEQFEIVAFRKGSDGKDLVFTRERESTAVLQNSHQKTCCHRELTDGISTANDCTQESSSEEKQKIKIRILNPLLGVPITFLDKHNPEQFEIIGISVADSPLMTKHYADYVGYRQDGTKTGRTGSTFGCCPVVQKNDGRTVYYKNVDGIEVQATYQRIFIRQRLQ